jgi:hypothetical protein
MLLTIGNARKHAHTHLGVPAVTGGVNPHIDGGIFEVEDRPTVGARLDYLTICGFEAAGRRGHR